MKLNKVTLDSFKSIRRTSLDVEETVTVLVGPNESGKTNIMVGITRFDLEENFEDTDTCYFSEHIDKGYSPDMWVEYHVEKGDESELGKISTELKNTDRIVISSVI